MYFSWDKKGIFIKVARFINKLLCRIDAKAHGLMGSWASYTETISHTISSSFKKCLRFAGNQNKKYIKRGKKHNKV